MSRPYVHLHCHSNRSFKDGLNPVDDLVARAAELEQPGLAITEHGHLHSAAQLAIQTRKAGIKPVFGMEIYEAVPETWDLERDKPILDRKWDSGESRYHHLTIWVQNLAGWQNLCRLHSLSYTPEFKPKNQPLIDRAHLLQHPEGLLIGLGCIQSKVNQALIREGRNAAYEIAQPIVEAFGKDRVFMEVMANLPDQVALIRDQRMIAQMLGIKCLATNDTHYVWREDGAEHAAHHTLVQARKFKKKDTEDSKDKSDDGFGGWYGSDEFYMKTGDEMLATGGLLAPEIDLSLEILDMVAFDFWDLPEPKPPAAPVPAPGEDPTFDAWVAAHT